MAKYHIVIDRDACVGDGLCSDKAPDVFISDEEGKPIIMNEDTKWPDNILWIAQNCPVDAVKIYDTETGELVWPKEEVK